MLREQSAANPARMQAALAGLRKYQEAAREPPPAPMPALAEALGATLRDYGGDGPAVLFVPSLINPPNVLDMGERSLLRWLSARGRRAQNGQEQPFTTPAALLSQAPLKLS